MELIELKERITKAKSAVILSHRSPDGDSVGSSLAMYGYLKNYLPEVQVITPDKAPKFLNWLPNFDSIINYEENKKEAEKKLVAANLIVCLDFNTPSRMGDLEEGFNLNSNAFIVNIDHHQDPANFADYQISDTSASSTCQMVFDFISSLEDTNLLDKNIADALYTGIVTDTGSFRFSSTSKHTHNIVAHLFELGVKSSEIHSNIYDSYSLDRLKLLGFALNERFKVYSQLSTGIIYLSENDLDQFNFQKGDTEGLVNYPLSVDTIKVAILLTEKGDKVKMSFRSKDAIKVNEIASKYFEGGGHFNAAGGVSYIGMEATIEKLENILPEFKEMINA